MDDFTSVTQQLNEAISNAESYLDGLCEELSAVDKEICDIRHYIEFNALSAANGYEAYRMLRERLLKRRTIKDQMTYLNAMRQRGINNKSVKESNKLLTRERKYTPRVLTDLFKEGCA